MIARRHPIQRSSPPKRKSRLKSHSSRPGAVADRKAEAAFSRMVKRRAGWMCELCGVPEGLYVTLDPHHLMPKGRYPEHLGNPNNGLALCRACHEGVDTHRKQFQAWLVRFMAGRPADARTPFLRHAAGLGPLEAA